jgi:DNA-binding NtrC family response regulator
VGKTTLARWVHNQSSRRDEPFLDVACAALPSTLIESELFGHVRGAFTSADRDQRGKLRAAGCGTLLLDEVDCLPIDVQAKLLRAVEQRLFEPVGSSKSEKLLARLVVASNRPLDQEVAAGRFRSDLYYRLSVLEFRVPPLRERLDAVLSMAEAFVRQFAASHGRSVTGISVAASQALLDYSWPGNIRELRNAMDHAVALSTGSQLQWSDLPEAVRRGGAAAAVAVTAGHASPALPLASQPAGPLVAGPQVSGAGCLESNELSGATARLAGGNQLQAIREKAERDLLLATLARNNNNRSKTAAELGISRVTLYKRLERLGIGPGPLDQMAAGGVS